MILTLKINSNLEINTLEDLSKLKPLIENSNLKVNASEIARDLGVDRRTVQKYLNGYEKKKNRNKHSQFDDYYDIIKELLINEIKVFAYKRILWQYLKDNYGMPGAESSFRRYIRQQDEFNAYFVSKRKAREPASSSGVRFETDPGEQAQLDWKESLTFVLNTGEEIVINIFVLILSYSRFRVYRLSISKTQDVLLNFMCDAFEIFGGVPKEIVTDNMKTVMDISRTEYSPGKVNTKFQQFADDFGFKVHPCIAAHAFTKAKVESPMEILDEILAYNGDLSYFQLIQKVNDLNERENNRFHDAYQAIPILYLANEKNFLNPLPHENIRSYYKIATKTVQVNSSSMISYKSNQYSVPPEYKGKTVQRQVYDDHIHIYHNTNFISAHKISNQKLNYHFNDYVNLMKISLPFKNEEEIEKIAKENLKKIGARYE